MSVHFQKLHVDEDEDENHIIDLEESTNTPKNIMKCPFKKCGSLFNSWPMVVAALLVFFVAIAISVVIVVLVGEPRPPFYNGL